MPPDRRTLLVASNRGPVTFREESGGELVARRGGGGLITALAGLARHHDVTWIAHAQSEVDLRAQAGSGGALAEHARGGAPYRLRFVGELDTHYDLAYNLIENPLLWFVCHRLWAFGDGPVIDRRAHAAWRSYETVNERFAAAIDEEAAALEHADAQPVVIVHDYQLLLVPGMVRARQPELFLQFFFHIPWPEPGAWRCLPRAWIRAMVESLLSCEIVGFQTSRDVAAFLRTAERYAGADIDLVSGVARFMGKVTRVRSYPVSVAVDEFEEFVQHPTVQRYRERIASMRPPGGSLIVRVDRTDPSKNIVRGLLAYELMLREHPELHGRVSMFCQLDPSRQQIAEYRAYTERITGLAGQLQARYATDEWQPLHINLDPNFLAAVASYCEYDVLFVNPVADGMNLVCKEGPLVNRRDGVVCLSDQAGAYHELGPYVTTLNPFDVAQQADAMYEAITMGGDQRSARAQMLREHVQVHDVRRWMDQQVEEIDRLATSATLPVR